MMGPKSIGYCHWIGNAICPAWAGRRLCKKVIWLSDDAVLVAFNDDIGSDNPCSARPSYLEGSVFESHDFSDRPEDLILKVNDEELRVQLNRNFGQASDVADFFQGRHTNVFELTKTMIVSMLS